jgi:2-hydroxycyclohexanecarboxyl-CoA dehydrogenase
VRGLAGKVVFITGSGRGIGRAMAERFVAEHARVAVADLDKDTATETAAVLGEAAVAVHVDVTDRASVAAAVEETEALLGTIDVLVNNAGWDKITAFVETDEELWDRIIAVNLKGVLHCSRAIVPGMIGRRAGRVVNVSSDAGRVGSSGESVYSATKAGVIGFTKTLAREVARHGITVNAVCPGPTETPLLAEIVGQGNEGYVEALKRQIPLRRLGRPDDVAGAVAFLASDDAGFITGQTLSVSGGLTMA